MSDVYDITLIQGSSLALRFSATTCSGTVLDLTSYTTSGCVKHRYSDTTGLLALSPIIVSPTGGLVDLTITEAQSAALPVMQGVYDVEVYSPSSTFKLVRGYINVLPEVTK